MEIRGFVNDQLTASMLPGVGLRVERGSTRLLFGSGLFFVVFFFQAFEFLCLNPGSFI